MKPLIELLSGADRRSIGKSDFVVGMVLKNIKLFDELFTCMYLDDKVVRMRAADAIQKIVEIKPALIKKYKHKVLYDISKIEQHEVRWHVAQLIPHLDLSKSETSIAISLLQRFLNDDSKIVKAFSLQALAELAFINPELKQKVISLIKKQMQYGSPAVISRGKKLLKLLDNTRFPPVKEIV
jgi:hypothetical protein